MFTRPLLMCQRKDGYNRYSVEFIVDNVPFEGQIVVALNGNNAMFYDIVGIKEKRRLN